MKMFMRISSFVLTMILVFSSMSTGVMAAESGPVFDDTSKALIMSFGRFNGAEDAGFVPSYDFDTINGTYVDKYSYYRTYDADCLGSPVPMTGVYVKNGADDSGNNKAIFTPMSLSDVLNVPYEEDDRIHFSSYMKLISGKLSYLSFLPASIGVGVTPSVSLKDVTSDKWTRIDVFYQPKVTYEYTVTKDGVTENASATTNKLITTKTSPRVNCASFWQAVLPACGVAYDSSASYELSKITFGETSVYINGVFQYSKNNSTDQQSSFYGFSDISPNRITIHGSDASVGFAVAISNFAYGQVKNFDKENIDFGKAVVNGTELYTVNDDTRTIALEASITPADIKVPSGCTVAVYSSATPGEDMKYSRLGDDAVIQEGNIVSVADEDHNLTYYNVVSEQIDAGHKFVGKAAELPDPCYRFTFRDAFGIGGKAADDASMLFDYDYSSDDPYTEYSLGISSSELGAYNGYIKVAFNLYPTAEMKGITLRIGTNKSASIASPVNIADFETNRWNRVEYIIKVEGGIGSVAETYVNGKYINSNNSKYASVVDGKLYSNFRIGLYVPGKNSADFAPLYFDDIHTYFSKSRPELYGLPRVPVCVAGDYVSSVSGKDAQVRILTSELALRPSDEKIQPNDVVVAEKSYTTYDKVYAYGAPFVADVLIENAPGGVCAVGAPVRAVAQLGRDCNVYIAERDSTGKEVGVAVGRNLATYVPKAVGNTIKIMAADVNNMAPLIEPKTITVGEYTEYFTYADLGDNVDFIPEKMRSYLNDTYDSCDKYADAKQALDKPEATTLTWDCTLDDIDSYVVNISENSDMTDAYSYAATDKALDIYNLKVGTRYYWNVTAISNDGSRITGGTTATFKTVDNAPRLLYIDGIVNARDIGGWKISDTQRVKQGMLIRTAKPNTPTSNLITTKGIATMTEQLGIRTEIDFRTEANHPYGLASVYPGVNYIRCPFASASFDNKPAIIDIFAKLADESNYPVNYHCLAGADRTGLISYLINGVLGVSREDLLRDYMLTNFTNNGQWRPISGISNYIDLIDNYEGATYQQKVYGYLVNEIGVRAEHLDSLIEIMTEDIPQ